MRPASPTAKPSDPARFTLADADRLHAGLGGRHPTPRGARRLAEALAAAEPATPGSGWDRPAPACPACGWDHAPGAGCDAPPAAADAAPIPQAIADETPRVAYWAAALMIVMVSAGLIAAVGVAAARRGDPALGYIAGLALVAIAAGLLWAMHAEAAHECQGGRRGGRACLSPTADGASTHATHDASRPPALVRPRLLPPGGRGLDVVG